MKINEAFPSTYLKAGDLHGREWHLMMSHVAMEDLGSDRKLVLYFNGAEKGLVLNRTNAEMIATMHGDDTDYWQGRPLTLKPDKTQFQGKIVDCIRVVWKQPEQPPAQQNGGAQMVANAAQQTIDPNAAGAQPGDPSDDIPF